MKTLESGKDKIQKICDAIRKETLDPAKQEAQEMIENARIQASEITRLAEEKAAQMKASAIQEMEERKRVFEASLQLSCRQGIDLLKQKIEQELLQKELSAWVREETSKPDLIAEIIRSSVRALEEQGVEEDLDVSIPKSISPRAINQMLGERILERLKGDGVRIGDFDGGIVIRLEGRHIAIDIRDSVVRDLISSYIRSDLRQLVFGV